MGLTVSRYEEKKLEASEYQNGGFRMLSVGTT